MNVPFLLTLCSSRRKVLAKRVVLGTGYRLTQLYKGSTKGVMLSG